MPESKMDEITPETLFEAVKSVSANGHAEFLSYLRAAAIQMPPEDGEVMARMADILELLLG
jgi:hypothetical protein